MSYKIVRQYMHELPAEIIKTGLTLEEAQTYCCDPETSSLTCKSDDAVKLTKTHGDWFDGYKKEK